MPNNPDRIEQFRNMAAADPDNELGHFSLGRALLEAGQPADAAKSLRRAVEINPNLSRAYQLIAQAELQQDNTPGAIDYLTRGVTLADQRGDLMPRDEMVAMLKELGAPVPEISRAAGPAVGEGQVLCRRCGKPGPQLAKAPFRSEFGEKVLASTCQSCWREAIGMGTKVINELRLPMHDPKAQQVWDQHIREFLNLS